MTRSEKRDPDHGFADGGSEKVKYVQARGSHAECMRRVLADMFAQLLFSNWNDSGIILALQKHGMERE